jgi:hypothetical protein
MTCKKTSSNPTVRYHQVDLRSPGYEDGDWRGIRYRFEVMKQPLPMLAQIDTFGRRW